jgi:hypothetical protein
VRDQTKVFDGLIGDAELVGGNYFSALVAVPALGRLLTPADDGAPGANPVAVLSYHYWAAHLARTRAWWG